MLSSSLGSPTSSYGNINLGLAQVPLYVWGAWEIIGHYQPPVKEEPVTEQPKAPEPPQVIDHSETIHRLKHEARLAEIAHTPVAKKVRPTKAKEHNDDEDVFFILM